MYHRIIYGDTSKDSSLLANLPRFIRSDEWQWTTPMALAQANNGYRQINSNLGQGQDMSLILDAPYKDWSTVFKPQNFGYFILPSQQAFAFHWWLMGYLLITSCYLFVLLVLPCKKIIAALLSLSLFFSPFVQWWYQYTTLGSLYYCLFLLSLMILLVRAKTRKHIVTYASLFSYVLACFALVQYPPFQIACVLASLPFAIGYLLLAKAELAPKVLLKRMIILIGASLVAATIVGAFLVNRSSTLHTINNTVYPGKRIVHSGGYTITHFFDGHLDHELTSNTRAGTYRIPQNGIINQSEDAHFLLLTPFLFLPCVIILINSLRKRLKIDWILLLSIIGWLGLVAWLYVPHLAVVGKLLLLDKVPTNRLMIGFGLLDLIVLTWYVKKQQSKTAYTFKFIHVLLYTFAVFIFELIIAFHTQQRFAGYTTSVRSVLFSIPIPVIIYCLLRRHFKLSILCFFVFVFFMSCGVNPLYKGTDIITNSALAGYVKVTNKEDPGTWLIEPAYLENFGVLNGVKSLSGTYSYPQLNLWSQIPETPQLTYNRFAHVRVAINRTSTTTRASLANEGGGDAMVLNSEVCDTFLAKNDAKYALTEKPLPEQRPCHIQLLKTFPYPAKTYYVYRIY